MKADIPNRVSALFSVYRGLHRGVYALFFARMVNAMGNFVFPFLTMLLTERYGYSAGSAGLFVFIASLSSIPGSIVGGKLSDRYGRRSVMVASQIASAFCFIPCGFLGQSPSVPWIILAGHFLLGAARPSMQAITTDLTCPETRKAAFSLTYLGNNIGFAIGPLVAGFLYGKLSAWIFWGDAITTVIAAALVLVFVPESLPSAERIALARNDDSPEKPESGSTLDALLRRPFLLVFLGLTIVTGFVYSQHTFSLPIQLNHVFGDRGPVYFGFIMSTNAVVVILFTTPIIALTSRLSPAVNQALASLFYAAGFGMLFCMNSFPLYIVSTAVWTVGEVLAATNSSVYVANHTPITHRGRFNAAVPIITSAGSSSCPLLMGYFIGAFPLPAVWILSFVLALAAAAGLFALDGIENRSRGGARKGSVSGVA